MKPNKVIAACASLAVLALSALSAWLPVEYLTEYGSQRFLGAGGIALGGLLLAVLLCRALSKRLTTRRRGRIAAAFLALLLVASALSMFYSGRITYARFGLTVCGLIPVPTLDVTAGAHRVLWFRDKSHLVTLSEIQPLLSPDTEIVIIGIGWQSLVRVDDAVRNLKGPRLEILPTPDAFRLFNECRSQGRKVVILAHSTC